MGCTNQVCEEGVLSMPPDRSTARTSRVCRPGLTPLRRSDAPHGNQPPLTPLLLESDHDDDDDDDDEEEDGDDDDNDEDEEEDEDDEAAAAAAVA